MPAETLETVEVVSEEQAPVTVPSNDHRSSEAFSDILAGLKDNQAATSTADPTPDPEAPDPPADTAEQPAAASSRRGQGYQKKVAEVQAEADAKVSEAQAERDRIIAEYEETRKENERLANEQKAQQAQLAQLMEQYGSYVGTAEEIAQLEAETLKSDTQVTDWDVHEQAKARLRDLKERRGILPLIEAQKKAEAWGAIAGDFNALAADLPEAARAGYLKNDQGIPAAVRYYARTLLDAQKEEYEGELAELRAELDREKARPHGRTGSPEVGGLGGSPRVGLDPRTASPEELISEGLRQNAREQARGRR